MESLLFWSLYMLMCPYKSRTKIFNPTREACTQSRTHILDMSITNEEKENETEPRVSRPRVPIQGVRWVYSSNHSSGDWLIFRIYLQVSSMSFRPPVHANVPLGGQMSKLTPPGLFQYFDILTISCF